MSTDRPLMPKATAVWLVENTALSFDQIAEFCGLHILEVQGIADGDVAAGIRGKDPITGGELSRDEIKKAEADANHRLKLLKSKIKLPEIKAKKAARYTPTSRRQDRPNAILWLVKNHPELKDSQIIKLVGTTKPTITQIRERTHWNSPNLIPQDPVTLGLCTQIDLDGEVQKAAVRVKKELEAGGQPPMPEGTLAPAAVTTGYDPTGRYDLVGAPGTEAQPDIGDMQPRADGGETADTDSEEARVFAKLQGMAGGASAPGEEEQPDIDAVFGSGRDDDAEADNGDAQREDETKTG